MAPCDGAGFPHARAVGSSDAVSMARQRHARRAPRLREKVAAPALRVARRDVCAGAYPSAGVATLEQTRCWRLGRPRHAIRRYRQSVYARINAGGQPTRSCRYVSRQTARSASRAFVTETLRQRTGREARTFVSAINSHQTGTHNFMTPAGVPTVHLVMAAAPVNPGPGTYPAMHAGCSAIDRRACVTDRHARHR